MGMPGSAITVVFDNYGVMLRRSAVFAILVEARFFAGEGVLLYGPLAPMGTMIKSWKQIDAVLEVTPSDRMTWFNLLTAIEGVLEFVSTWRRLHSRSRLGIMDRVRLVPVS